MLQDTEFMPLNTSCALCVAVTEGSYKNVVKELVGHKCYISSSTFLSDNSKKSWTRQSPTQRGSLNSVFLTLEFLSSFSGES